MDIAVYNPGAIKPIAKPGENVLLVALNQFNLYEVAYVDSMPVSGVLVQDTGALVASFTPAGSNQTTTPTLDLGAGQLGHWRFQVMDDIVVSEAQPAAAPRHTLRGRIVDIGAFTHVHNPHDEPSEFFTFEQQLDTAMALTIRNPRPIALTQSRIMYYGLKYILVGKLDSGKKGVASAGHLQPLESFNSIDQAMASNYKFVAVPIGGWGQ